MPPREIHRRCASASAFPHLGHNALGVFLILTLQRITYGVLAP